MDNAEKNIKNAEKTASYYDHFWPKMKSRLIYPERFRASFIIDNIREFIPSSNLEILDLGCGRGWLAAFLSPFGSVTGVDFSQSGIELAKNEFGNYGNFLLADTNSPTLGIPQSQKFDLVVCSEVIEHVLDHEALVKQITNFLKPGGWCILTTPNGRIWPKYKSGSKILAKFLKREDIFQPVENWIAPEELAQLFKKFDLSIKRHEGQTFYRFGYPPLMHVGWFEFKFVDIILRSLGFHHKYAEKLLPLSLYQIVVAQLRS